MRSRDYRRVLDEFKCNGILRWFLGKDIETSASAVSTFYGIQECFFIDDTTASNVDYANSLFAFWESNGVYEICKIIKYLYICSVNPYEKKYW